MSNPNGRTGFFCFSIAVLFLFAGLLTVAGSTHGIADSQADPSTVRQTRNFLVSPAVGRQVVEYMHFGAHYRSHKFLKAVAVYDKDKKLEGGYFGLEYRFGWIVGGSSDVIFLCDRTGRIYDVQVLANNALTNQPFGFGNDVIQILGNEMLDSTFAGPGSTNEAVIHDLEDRGDARIMLAWLLANEQASLTKSGKLIVPFDSKNVCSLTVSRALAPDHIFLL